MSFFFFILSNVFFIIGMVKLLSPDKPKNASVPGQPAPAVGLKSSSSARIKAVKPEAAPQLDWIKVHQRIYVPHPVRGEMMVHVVGKIEYEELWQLQRRANEPWVPTGKRFQGFWLEGNLYLLSWLDRLYLLDERVDLTDADIASQFQPYARQFAQSDQKADIYFSYPPAVWHIDDIGKFRVSSTQGDGLRFQPGAIGRFIHSSGDSERALVVEDYEGGAPGLDSAWIGYRIREEGLKPA